jgi:hypothetical protein
LRIGNKTSMSTVQSKEWEGYMLGRQMNVLASCTKSTLFPSYIGGSHFKKDTTLVSSIKSIRDVQGLILEFITAAEIVGWS